MKLAAKATILFDSDGEGLKIEIYDTLSGQCIGVKIGPKETLQALSRLSRVDCEMEVQCLERLGKKHIMKELVFELPPETDYMNRKQVAIELADKLCPEGWTPDLWFNSRDSFHKPRSDGKVMARTTIRKWVDPDSEEAKEWEKQK